jgi:hypothetical protein
MGAFGDVLANNSTWGAHIPGTNTNDNTASGEIGEYSEAFTPSTSPVSLTTATAANIFFVSLTAGDWDVEGTATLKYTSATQSADGQAAFNNVTATLPGNDYYIGFNNTRQTTTTSNASIQMPKQRISISVTTNIYLVVKATFTAGTCGAFGDMIARRVR